MLSYLNFQTPIEGAQTVIYLAVADEVSHVAGQYFSNCKVTRITENLIIPNAFVLIVSNADR